MPARTNTPWMRALGALILTASLGLGILALTTLPAVVGLPRWAGYRVLLVEASVPEAEVLAALSAAGIRDPLCETTAQVLVCDWSGLEALTVAEASARIAPGDPRYDSYLGRIGLWFKASLGQVPYRVMYLKEAPLAEAFIPIGPAIESALGIFKGRFRLGDAAEPGPARGGGLSFALTAMIIMAACLIGPLTGAGATAFRSYARGLLPRSLDRIAFRLSLSLPWIALAAGAQPAGAMVALWGLAVAEAADRLDLPLEEYRRGGGLRPALASLALQGLPHWAFPAIAILGSIVYPATLPSIGIALLGSMAALPGYALLSRGVATRRRFTPMPIAAAKADSRRGPVAAGRARAFLACVAVVALGLGRLLSSSSAPSSTAAASYPRPFAIGGSLRPSPDEARRRMSAEGDDVLPGVASYLGHRAFQEALPYVRVAEQRPDPFASVGLPQPPAAAASRTAGIVFDEAWARTAYASAPPSSVEALLLRQGSATVGRAGTRAGPGLPPLAPIEALLYIFLLVPPMGRLLFGAPLARGVPSVDQRQEA